MADSYLPYQNPASTDAKLDSESLTVGANTVERERVQIAGAAATDIAAVTAANGLDVDVTRVIPGTSATHLGKAIDTAAGATDTGVASLAVRDDTLATLTPVDGDWVPLRTDQYGALWVSLATKLNSTDDSVSAAVTNVIPGTTATDLGKAEDAAHSSGDVGVMALAVRRDTAAASSGTTGDYEPLQTDALGRLRTTGTYSEDAAHVSGDAGIFVMGVSNEAQSTLAADGDYIGLATDTKGNQMVVGNIANDGVDAGNPLKIGGKAFTGTPTAVANGDRVDAWFTERGAQVISGGTAHDAAVAGLPVLIGVEARDTLGTAVATGDVVRLSANRYGHQIITAQPPSHASSNGTPITATTTSVIAAPSASTHLRVLRIHISNGGATPTWAAVRDGAAGTQHYRTYLPQGGVMSLNLNLSGPLDLTTATRLDIVLSAAGSVEYEIDYLTVAD